MSWLTTGAEIIAIEDSDAVGFAEAAASVGEITFRSLEGFVTNVLADVGARNISLLHVQVHGNPDGMGFGEDWMSVDSFDTFRAQLRRLSSKFTSSAWVDLRGCEVGMNLPLMHRFRELWGVGVVAGRGLQNNLFDLNFGMYQIVSRDGRESTSFSAPPWVAYDVGRRATRGILSHM